MKKGHKVLFPAEALGIILLLVAAGAFFFNPWAAVAVAVSYIILCLMASFFPQTNIFMSVISRGKSERNWVALTFDDGPSEPITRQILDLLDKYAVKATFFVTGVNAGRHPEIIREIIGRGHTVGNHSFSHDNFLMLKRSRIIYREISRTQCILEKIGINTVVFRPPVGIVNPKLGHILDSLGMYCITFSCRAGDAGNFFVKGISRKILKKVRPDDIILLHDTVPRKEEDKVILLQEIDKLITGIMAKGLSVVPLQTLIRRPIMTVYNI
jgi:peptidoglycan/xylan/chitin deacetylase (PgdA/CDA1 family)